MRAYLLQLLKTLEQRLVPPAGHHAITYGQYGNDVLGWEDRLALHVRRPTQNITLFLDEADLEKPIEQLVEDIVRECRGSAPAEEPARRACLRCSEAEGVVGDPSRHVTHAMGEACPRA